MRKLKFGFFSFTGDEGCMMIFLESLNSRLARWQKAVDFRYSKLLREKNVLEGIDVAFVEGAISTEDEVKRIREVRKNCKTLVAIGACAIDASPAAHRNFFAAKELKEIKLVLKKFNYLDKVYPLSKFVKVDHNVPGCPMDEKRFIGLVERFIAKGI
jgi:coenzyme F420-reducing hydrogenase gamma subunit